ncbi:NodT family efflux transporter outer membrane factor (OMF) lipoprotein [Chitinophaga japonensis]|uniref:NodT family efflux transporter outer membrane factor (OMF) lipoprotein n=2 Tax=Chitinophaga japonensis TaxID=104662 RepID=A0A562T709_CHIJA|nr:NodT family efflux transporter outer membrane factor (OMF) lipoprotein [Chitinophaga japonensis]
MLKAYIMNNYKRPRYNIKYLAALGLLLVLGCRLPQPLVLPEQPAMPDTFTGSTDTAGIGHMPWQQFFKDARLRALIDTALQRNYSLRKAEEKVKISGAVLLAAKHAWLPTANLTASAGVDKFGDYTMNGVGNYDTNLSPNIDKDQRIPDPAVPDYFLGLRSSWQVDLWGKLKQRKKAALMRFLASTQGKRLITTLLVSEVAAHYYELIALDSELAILQKNIALQETALATVQVQKAAGRATLLAEQQFQAQLLDTRSREYTTRQRQLVVEAELNYLLGRFPQPVPRGKQLAVDTLAATWRPGIPGGLLTNRPDIKQAELELAASKADVLAARKAFLPSLSITPYVGYNAFKAGLLLNPGSLAYGVLGSITAPLFNQKQLTAQYQIQQSNTRISYYDYQQKILRAYQEVSVALCNIANQQEVYKLKSKEVTVLQSAVSTANDLFLGGYASYLEIITAQKSVLEAELSLIQARRKMLAGTVQLYQALGGGWR